MSRIQYSGFGRIPLSDESLDLDDDLVEEEGSPGKEEQYDELDFNAPTTDPYALEPDFDTFDEDEWADDPLSSGGWDEGDDA